MSIRPLRVHTTDHKNLHIKPDELVEYLDQLAIHFACLNHSEKARAYRWLIDDIKEAVKEADR